MPTTSKIKVRKGIKGIKGMKGGVELKPSWNNKTKDEAITYFLENSMFRILTNNSISCITLIAKLNDTVTTPFISIDSLNFARDVTSILIKVMPSSDTILRQGFNTDWAVIDYRSIHNGIEINSYAIINREIETQKELYRKSIISSHSYLDASCPAIIGAMNPVQNLHDLKYKYFTVKTIIPRNGKSKLSELVSIQQILTAKNQMNNQPAKISLIFMEFMEGYDVLSNFQQHPRYTTFVQFALYEIHRLHLFGYFHGDSHFGNIMVNPDIQHYTTSKEPGHLGIIKLIDFGRTIELPYQSKKDLLIYPNYKFNLLLNERLFQLYFSLSKDAKLADVNPLIIESIRDSITLFNAKRKEFIIQILEPRLERFYEFSNISKFERNPPNLLHKLFPLSYGPYGDESYGGGLTKYGTYKSYGGLTDTIKPMIDLNITNDITMEEPALYTKMKPDIIEDKINYKLFKHYDWDEGREIVGNTLSETEKKMTLDDFKRVFGSALMQTDNEKTFNIPLFLKENLDDEYKNVGGKQIIKKKKQTTRIRKTKKNKSKKKIYNRKKKQTRRN